jgi:hypothetical protein
MKMIFSNVQVKPKETQKNQNTVKMQHSVINNTEVVQSMQWNMIGRLLYSRTCKSCERY